MADTSKLNDLVQTAIDGKAGYEQAADKVNDASLKTLFTQYAQQRATYATELQGIVRAAGGTPTDHGSAAAGLHRGWIGLKDALTGGDGAILGECIRGEEHAVKSYSDALQEGDVSADAKSVIARQHGEIEQALAHMNSLKSSHS